MDWRVHIDIDGSDVVRSLARLDWLLVQRSRCGRRLIARPAGLGLAPGIGGLIEIVTAVYPYAVGLGGLPPEAWADGVAVVAYGQRQLFCFRRQDDALSFGRRLR